MIIKKHHKIDCSISLLLEPLSRFGLLTYSFAYTSISTPKAFYKRTRLYIKHIPISRNLAFPCQSFGRIVSSDATVLTSCEVFNRNWEGIERFLDLWARVMRLTMELLYQLSYNGICFEIFNLRFIYEPPTTSRRKVPSEIIKWLV